MKSHFTRDATGQLGGEISMVPNPERITTINFAMTNYGFLIERNERLTPPQFIDRIKATYDCDANPQNAAVVSALTHLV